jgi:hypothetical protein
MRKTTHATPLLTLGHHSLPIREPMCGKAARCPCRSLGASSGAMAPAVCCSFKKSVHGRLRRIRNAACSAGAAQQAWGRTPIVIVSSKPIKA